MHDDQSPKLGPCCICGTEDHHVSGVVMLPVKNEVPGHGWGCFSCNLPPDGAVAVICEDCIDAWQRDQVKLQWACRGYPAEDGRVPIAQLTVPHKHDLSMEH